MVIEILVLIVLIILNAFFAASEIALISLNDNKIRMMAENGHKKAKLVQNLMSEPSRFLATIQIGITLAGFLASAFAAGSFAEELANMLYTIGIPISLQVLKTISVVVITLILSYFTLVLGELVPKRLALQKAEPIAMFAVTPLTYLSKISSPFVKLLTYSTNLIVRLFGVDPNAEDEHVTEEEIRMMVDVGKEKGTIQETEKIMINNIFEFDNKTVSDVMTHRTNIVAIPVDYTLMETIHISNKEKYSRIPVYENSIDHIIGILHVKDLIPFVQNNEHSFDLRTLLHKPLFVLESKPTDDCFKEMQKYNVHMAIVLDEYGGTDGIITIEDLLEEIVGNIFDEYDEPDLDEIEIKEIGPFSYTIAGTTNLSKVEEILKINLPTEEFDTLSGFVIGQLGYIPIDENPVIEFNNAIFKVEEMNDKRIRKVKVTLINPMEE